MATVSLASLHFASTLTVINQLIESGKYVEVMPFSGRCRGVSDLPARRVKINRAAKFFLDNLPSVPKQGP
jgi:hypothetical protein